MKTSVILMKMKVTKHNYLKNQIYQHKTQILTVEFSMGILELNFTTRECSLTDVPATRKHS